MSNKLGKLEQLALLEDEINQEGTSNIVSKWLIFIKLKDSANHVISIIAPLEANICENIEEFKERTGATIEKIVIHPIFHNAFIN